MKDFIFDFYNPDIKVLFLFILVLAVLYFSQTGCEMGKIHSKQTGGGILAG